MGKLLHEELSYIVRGCAMEVRNKYGSGHKESVYQNAFAELLTLKEIDFRKEFPIKVYSPFTGKSMGLYRPDFLVGDKIIVELKAMLMVHRKLIDKLYDYLRNSVYELGFFINFGSSNLYIKRILYTNDRKDFLGQKPA
ncbi:MAG: GxxExxY protein [bacterium]